MKKIIILLFMITTILGAQEKVVSQNVQAPVKTETIEEKTYVQVSHIPQDAAKTIAELKNITLSLEKVEAKSKDMNTTVEPYCASVSELLNTSKYENIKDYNVRDLQKMKSELAVYDKQLEEWEQTLEEKIKIYDKNKDTLKEYGIVWNDTHLNALKEDVPITISDNINFVIKSIQELEESIKRKYDITLTASQLITNNSVAIKDMNLKLKDAESLANKKIFFRNEVSMFELMSENEFDLASYFGSIQTTVYEKYIELKGYFQAHNDLNLNFYLLVLLSTSFTMYANYLYRKKRLFINNDSYEKQEYFFIKNIFSTLVLMYALSIVAIYPQRPSTIGELITLVVFFPVIRILQTMIQDKYYKYLYMFVVFYTWYLINNNSFGHDLENRLSLVLINIVLMAYFVFVIKEKVLDRISVQYIKKTMQYAVMFSLVALFVSLVANFYGSVLLAHKISHIIFSVFYSIAIFYVINIILTGYVVILLRRRISTASFMLAKYSSNIESTAKYLIKIWLSLWLGLVIIRVLGIYPWLIALGKNILALSWDISGTVISVQSVVDFLIIVLSTWFIAKVIKVILEVEIFARFKLPRGAPTAILTILNYIIVISGTIIAFTSLGMTSQQFAIVFGALGVGIGFGLRNIIANFVSGIIMVFERPIQIGDTIEVGATMGSVQSIGARASTLQTFDGSEVIIPNADFIGKEIVNWTLSDERRRKTLEFKVGLDNDIDRILEIMRDITQSHPDVLEDPEPVATFKGFGEYTLDFKIYFWLSDNLIVAQSDVAIGIYKAMKKEGITMPVSKTHLEGIVK